MEKNGLIYFLLLWIVSICSVSCSCGKKILHGDINWCLAEYTICVYSCNEGYKKHDTVTWLRCSTSGQWVVAFSQWEGSAKELCAPKPCPTVISKGVFSAACNAVVGSTCSFSCEANYMRNTSASWVTCQTSMEWSPDLRSLCLRPDGQQCPYYIPKGNLNLACIREPGHTCSFTCEEGYRPSLSPPTIACGSDLEWNHNPENLCQEIICPKLFDGGSVSESCSRKYKSTCNEYTCNPGYIKLSRAYAVQCNKSGNWVNPDGTSSACVRDQLCPDKFPGGYIIWHCNRIPQESCTYYCYSGYLQNSSITWLTCQENRLWNVDTNLLCIQSDISNTSLSTTFRTTSPAATTRTTSYMSNTSSSTTFRTATTRTTSLFPELWTSISDERSGGGNVGAIVGIGVGAPTGIIIIVIIFLALHGKRICVPKRRGSGHVRRRCLRPRENPVRNVNTIRQQHNAESVSSFESPSYNGLYVHSFVQRIPSISNSYKYPGPPPSYSSIPPKESLPTYEEVSRDPSRFNVYI